MLDRVRIRTLRDAGHTLEEIAATVGVGKRSVQRILKAPPITSPESAPTPVSRGVGRPSTVEAHQDQVERILKEEPSLPTVERTAARTLSRPGTVSSKTWTHAPRSASQR